ncbi:uncharacterized protein LOC133199838 [Saccostrea echinata]|uniref:uncharacterized protein LOC133199838 n=1 Tax=Saccostrea echinata TaxID=191078 RepID=UPI002A839312|nr:uncharacterized protein LOC133199838 [Saccostrea echinata]
MDPFQIACKVYSHIVKRASAIAADTRTREGIYNKTDSAWLDDLVDIGRKLNDLQRKSKANDEKDQTALRNINRDLKMVSRNLDKCCKDLRKDIFFLWTQTEEFPEKNRGIPSVSLKNSSSGKISTKLTLEAKSDVAIRHHLWLRKLKGKYIVLYPSEEAEDKFEFQENENKLFLTIKNVDLQDEGSYFVVVETENGATVCREIVQLIADAQKATLDTDDEHDGKKTITETYINQIHIHHGENFVIGDSNTLNIKYDAKNKEEYSEDDSSCSSDTPLVEPTNPVTNLERELSNLDVLARKSKYKLKVLDVRGDGHCLYHAFRQGVHTYRLPDHPTELRRQLVKYLEFNPITPNGIPYKDFLCFPLDPDHGILEPEDIAIETVEKEEDQKELRWQRFLKKIQDGEWGGSLEIMGLAQMCNVPVTVLSVGMNSFRLNEIQFNYTDETALKPTVFIGHLKLGGKGVHFVSFRSLHKNAIEQPTSMQHGEQRWKTIQDGKVIVDHQLDKRIGCIEITAKNRSNATGFRVGSKYVMTAFHVMEDLLVPFWKQVYNRLNNEERRPLRWTAENLPVDGSWNLSNLISSLDPRKLPFASQHHDIVILELSQENNLPPPLILKDTNIPGVKFHLVGNSEGIKLQHVPGCQIIEDQAELTDIVNRGIDFFTGLGYEREQVELDYATCVLSPDHILFHSPMNIVHGASSSPLIVIKEKPQVIGMLLRGYPKLYFNDSRCIGAHPELLIESGISMEKVHSLLKEHSLIQLAEDLFSQNK